MSDMIKIDNNKLNNELNNKLNNKLNNELNNELNNKLNNKLNNELLMNGKHYKINYINYCQYKYEYPTRDIYSNINNYN
ncbi:hypothetical protein [Megavirus chiliensis]|uniref:Uncharacterized protein n=2 Tax=Megamimivirinae TaxID=3044648 RepID=A0A2L2DLL8_MIMIV|nr:hypothetical protein MegaChil _gp0190 [Megavirus chiliensis]AEQ33423.1 hypothetical protein [Megavirus chiliensis]AVG47027.1 hypothetical protein [Acanthamoeba polyphaga mimivirus]